ncbi:MAG TPA: fasciclin domain-containing protein [Draconibacterium sp.]|nr:fasciclin domain-containing protein [Draconibacterium sp.]
MKKIFYILLLIAVAVSVNSCREPERVAGFEDAEQYTIYDYIVENKDQFSDFLAILEVGGIDKTLSAYNPNGNGYTLFLPSNKAIDSFIKKTEGISSMNDILNNPEFAAAFGRYHVLNMMAHTQDFPFGAFPEPTLSEDYLTVSFIIQTDTSYYKINNQAGITMPNIEVSNGYIHEIETALEPITFTSYGWLQQNSGYSIFKGALELTGTKSLVDFNVKDFENISPVTMLVESDEVYNQNGIFTVEDLANKISPNDANYTNPTNPLNSYCTYHILTGGRYINDFEGVATNYTTLSEIPLNINGLGNDLLINEGKQVFDTIIAGLDTTIIDYIGFLYDESNITTQSGAIHMIDRMMKQVSPSRAIVTFEFWEEPQITEYRRETGSYLIEEKELLNYIDWEGADLYFTERGDEQTSAWGNDYLEITGDFKISYIIPKVVQGKYTVFLGAERYNSANALVEVYIDGKKVSSLVDLSQGGTANSPFQKIELGTIDFIKYESHKVEVIPLIPGRFLWDYIRFEPI